HSAQMLHEIESYAPKARLMKLFEHSAGKRIVGVGYAAISTAALCDGIDDHGVVRTVTARVHEHRALETEDRLQFPEPGERRIRRRVGAIGCVRITVTGPEYVAMSVAAARRRAKPRTSRVRIRGLAGWNIRHAVS